MLLSRQREGRATAMSDATRCGWRPAGVRAHSAARVRSVSSRSAANADISVWRVDTLPYAGVLNDPITGLMQCGPTWAWHTIVGGRFVVRDGEPVTVDVPRVLDRHRRAAERVSAVAEAPVLATAPRRTKRVRPP